MSRFVLKAGAGAVMFALAGGAASASEEVRWNLATWGNPRAYTAGIEKAAEYIAEQTGGNFHIEIHYGETISPTRQTLDGLSIGAFEMATLCTSYHPGKNPVGTVLDLPFLPFGNLDVTIAVHDAFQSFGPWVEEMDRWNARPYVSGVLPQYEFMGVGEPPRDLEDWDRKRVRALAGLGQAMRQLGATPTTVPAPETYTAMERGMVDAASWGYTYAFAAYRLHEIAEWVTEGMAIGTVYCPIVINQNAYEALPQEYKDLLEEAKGPFYEAMKEAHAAADAENLPVFRENLEVIEYTPEQWEQFKEVGGEPVWDAWVEQYEDQFDSRAVLDFVLETARTAAEEQGS